VTARGVDGPTAGRSAGREQVPVEAVLFDLDDTLLDTASAFGAAVAAIATEFLPELPAERHPEVVATWRLDRGGHYQAHVEGRTDYLTQRLARAQEIQTAFGGELLDADEFTRWGRIWDEAFAGAWRAFDDTAEALDRLRQLGVPVGCVTNADRAQQERKLAATGLTDHLPLLVTLDTFGVGKPDPRVFHEGARLLEVDPARVLYIGDEPVIDARAATEAGLRGVWLDRPGRRRGHAGEDAVALRRHGIPVIEELAGLHALL